MNEVLTEDEIVTAFSVGCDRKAWKARGNGKGQVVFSSQAGLISLVLDVRTKRVQVKFNKWTAAWGDYIGSIARGLFMLLNALKAGGLRFEAPTKLEGCTLRCSTGADLSVYVEFDGINVVDEEPEQKKVELPSLL